jgi:ankyrin repeat protein
MIENEIEGNEINRAAKSIRIRSRLAFLTGDDSALSPERGWDSDVRIMARSLQELLQDSADYIFSGDMKYLSSFEAKPSFIIRTTCTVTQNSDTNLPVHFLMYRSNDRWKIDLHQLEAALGLWLWSLKRLEYSSKLFKSKIITVDESKRTEYLSAIRLWVLQRGPILETTVPNFKPTILSTVGATLLNQGGSSAGQSSTYTRNHVLFELETRSSPVQLLAQDIFTVFIDEFADILEPLEEASPRQSQLATLNRLGPSTDQPYLGLINTHIEAIVTKFTAAGLGSREDALVSIIIPLLNKSKMPQLDEVMEELLSVAKSFRRARKFQAGEDLLRGLLHLGPPQFQERAIRSLGELYRLAIRSQKPEEHNFGIQGLKNMNELHSVENLHDEAMLVIRQYKYVLDYFEGYSRHTSRTNPEVERELSQFFDTLDEQSAKPRGLILIDEIRHHDVNPAVYNGILRWAIKENCPELIEDLWKVQPALINEVFKKESLPLFFAIKTGCSRETFECLLDWPLVRYDSYGRTALQYAAQEGHYNAVELLLKRGSDAHAADQVGMTALSLATENGHESVVKLLLRAGAHVSLQDSKYGSALVVAAYKGMTGVVKTMIQEGVDVNLEIKRGQYGSALTAAASQGHLETVKLLIQEGKADANAQLQAGDFGSALTAAACFGHEEIARFLVSDAHADANSHITVGYHGSPLAAACSRSSISMVKFLVQEAGADANLVLSVGPNGSALATVMASGRIEIIKFLIRHANAEADLMLKCGTYGSALAAGAASRSSTLDCLKFLIQEGRADPNLLLSHGEYGNALTAAAHGGNIGVVEYLVTDAKADVNLLPRVGMYGSPLAAYRSNHKVDSRNCILTTLMKHGANINQLFKVGIYGSALSAAAVTANLWAVKYLVQEGADVNLVHDTGDYGTALIAAVTQTDSNIVDFLISEAHGEIDLAAKVGYYGNALTAATYRKMPQYVELLVQRGANVNMKLCTGEFGSALVAAAGIGTTKCLKILLAAGADANQQLHTGKYGSALAAAAYWGQRECFDILVENGACPALLLESGQFQNALEAAEMEVSHLDFDNKSYDSYSSFSSTGRAKAKKSIAIFILNMSTTT